MYAIEYDKSASKQLGKLDRQARDRVQKQIKKLAEEPRPRGAEPLTNMHGLYRIRVGAYRVSDEAELVCVVRIGPRRDVYKKL